MTESCFAVQWPFIVCIQRFFPSISLLDLKLLLLLRSLRLQMRSRRTCLQRVNSQKASTAWAFRVWPEYVSAWHKKPTHAGPWLWDGFWQVFNSWNQKSQLAVVLSFLNIDSADSLSEHMCMPSSLGNRLQVALCNHKAYRILSTSFNNWFSFQSTVHQTTQMSANWMLVNQLCVCAYIYIYTIIFKYDTW